MLKSPYKLFFNPACSISTGFSQSEINPYGVKLKMDEIEQKVKKIIAEQLGIKEEDIKNESSFIEDLGADSLTTVEMSLALEDAFGIEIPDTEQENLRTVQQAVDFVKAAVNK